MKFKFLILFVFTSFCTAAQPNDCGCPVVFNEAIEKVEQVYSGYKDKVNNTTKTAYNQRKTSYIKFAASVYNMLECHQLIIDFLDFYKDNHIFLQYSTPAGISNRQILLIKDKEIKNLVSKDQASKLAGIWESEDGKFKYAIVPYKSPVKGYTMITLQHPDSLWPRGTVKAIFTDIKSEYPAGYLFHDDFYMRYTSFALQNDVLDMGKHRLIRRQKKSPSKPSEIENVSKTVGIIKLNDSTFYVRIPYFMQSDVRKLDSLLKINRAKIAASKHLLIDIRGNGGGDANPPRLLLQVLGNDTLQSPYWDYRVSKPYLAKLENRMKAGRADSTWYKRLNGVKGNFLHEKSAVIRLDSVFEGVRKIAVLMDEGCASAAEMFIYYARQSENVTLYGHHSSGTMDYGPTDNFPLSCKNFDYFAIPFGRNGWVDSNPIDKKGFQPDIEIPANINWVDFVIDHWKNP